MKKILLIILLFVSITGYSQNYLMKSNIDIVNTKGEPSGVGETPDANGNSLQYVYYINDTKLEGYYFDNFDFCVMYAIWDDYKYLTYYIKDLNTNYVIIDDKNWEYYTRDYIYKASLAEQDETTFYIQFTFNKRKTKI